MLTILAYIVTYTVVFTFLENGSNMRVLPFMWYGALLDQCLVACCPRGGGGGVLRCCLDGGARLKPPNPYPSLRVILAEKGIHY